MRILQNFVEQLTGTELVDALVEYLLEHMEDFREDHRRYSDAVSRLKAEPEALPVEEVVSAIYRRTAEALLFAGGLGLKMNYDHFKNPMTPNCTWQQLGFNDCLQEHIAHSLPEYRNAEAILSDRYHSPAARRREICCALGAYVSHLETVGPKLAHYYGYLLGNTLLCRTVPGYTPDMTLTVKYNTMLEEYFGKHFLPMAL